MQSDLIYDIGMHTGEDTIYYLKKGFKVIAIEANPELVINANIEFYEYVANGRLIIINIGLHHSGGLIKFYKNAMTQFSSFIECHGVRGGVYEIIDI